MKTHTTFSEEGAFCRKAFDDEETALSFVMLCIEKRVPGHLKIRGSFLQYANNIATHNINKIFAYSESPIERSFLGCVVANLGIGLDVFAPPKEDALTAIGYRRSHLESTFEWSNTYEHLPDDIRPSSFRQLMRFVLITDKDFTGKVEDTLDEMEGEVRLRDLGHFNKLALMPQAKFTSIGSKGARVDALIFSLGDEDLRISVECDGYEFHGRKDSFIADRARDRAFADAGIKVRRYAGSEIHADPYGCAVDLVDYLDTLRPTVTKPHAATDPVTTGRLEEFIKWLRDRKASGEKPTTDWEWAK